MKILITGGAGFFGSNLAIRLIEEGQEVTIIDNLSNGKIENLDKKMKFYEMDIQDKELIDIFNEEKFDIVFHQAAQTSVTASIDNSFKDASINIMGTINILESCVESKVKKIIFASSAAVYGEPQYLGIDEEHTTNPTSFYGLSKLVGEHYIKMYYDLFGLNYCILRYSNVYGIKQGLSSEAGVISIFLDELMNGNAPTVYGDGKATRDYIYVDDIIEANVRSIDKCNNDIINIGTGIETPVSMVYETIANALEIDTKPIHVENRKGEIQNSYYNIEKSNKVLGWKPQYSL